MFKRLVSLGGAHAVTLLIGLATTVMWTRFMPKEMYGQYKVVISILSFIGAFCFSGVAEGAVKSAASGFVGNFVPLVRMKVLSNFAGAAAIIAIAFYYTQMRASSPAISASLLVAALVFPAYNLSDIWPAWLNGKSSFRLLIFGKFFRALLPFFGVGIAIIMNLESLWVTILITFASISLLNLVMLNWSKPSETNLIGDDKTLLYSKHATVALTFGALLALDMTLLEHFHGATEVAIYAVAMVLPDQFKMILGLVNQVVAPKVYACKSLTRLLIDLRPTIVRLACFCIVAAFFGYLLFPIAVSFLFSEQYSLAGEIGRLLWVAVALTAPVNTFLGAVVLSRQHAGRAYVGSIGYSVVFLLFCFAFLNFGAAGFIYARISTYVITFIFHLGTLLWLVRKEKSDYSANNF